MGMSGRDQTVGFILLMWIVFTLLFKVISGICVLMGIIVIVAGSPTGYSICGAGAGIYFLTWLSMRKFLPIWQDYKAKHPTAK